MEACSICRDEYNLNDKRPFRLQCNVHKLCRVCLETLYTGSGGTITCPEDNILSNEDISTYREDEQLIRTLTRSFVACSFHPDNHSSHININTFKTVCHECYSTSPERTNYNRALFRMIKTRLFQVFLSQKSNLSFEMKNYVIQSLKSTLGDQYSLLHLINLYTSKSTNCPTHPSEPFSVLSVLDYSVGCNLCNKEGINISYSQIFQNFCSILSNDLYSPALPGSILKNFFYFSPFFISPIIEAYLALTKPLQSFSQKSCMKCGKSFKLGARMPYTLSCGHFMCKVCVDTNPICPLHQIPANTATPYFEESLYTIPQCKNCMQSEMGYHNLPLHFFCDCIICSNCSVVLRSCVDCLDYINSPRDGRLKVHKRALNVLTYLKNDVVCARCTSEISTALLVQQFIPVCQKCLHYTDQKLDIKMTMEFDKVIYEWIGKWLEQNGHPKFATYTIGKKIREISIVAGNQQRNNIINYTQEVKEVRRFEIILPLHQNDPRSFRPITGTKVFLEIKVSAPIFFLGLILAGSVNNTSQRQNVAIYNAQNNLVYREQHETRGKYNFVFCRNVPSINLYKVEIEYLGEGVFYCGRALTEDKLRVSEEGVDFEFGDMTGSLGQFKGPILGLLYSN